MIPCYIVDSFTDKPFCGNPAGVCITNNILSEQKMLSIAKELGLSETAFIKGNDENNTYSIRYFSPKMEIPLCGHATLAASKVLFDQDERLKEICFINIQELRLQVQLFGDLIQMEFPLYDTMPSEVPEELLSALGLEDTSNVAYNKETNILILEIESSEVLQNLTPDFVALQKSHDTINGVLVTALSDKQNFDFESRYFWPWSGTNEDPATGGTHTFLAQYWGEKLGKSKMNSYQCSERSGFMEVELIDNTKMYIRSKAQVILKGSLEI